jgi:hypothetical protein
VILEALQSCELEGYASSAARAVLVIGRHQFGLTKWERRVRELNMLLNPSEDTPNDSTTVEISTTARSVREVCAAP